MMGWKERQGSMSIGGALRAAIRCCALAWSLLVGGALGTCAAVSAEASNGVTPELRQQALATLQRVLVQEQEWVKVHAAEFLLKLDHPQGIRDTFLQQLQDHGQEFKYRIGIWRVLARAAADNQEAIRWTGRIRDVLADPAAPDRLHAMESLAKLRYKVLPQDVKLVEDAAREPTGPMAPFAAWVLVNSGRPAGSARLADLLHGPERGLAAYALRHLDNVSPVVRQELLDLAQREPAGAEVRMYLICAAAIHAPEPQKAEFRTALLEYIQQGSISQRYLACETLGHLATKADLPLLTDLLSDPVADVRSSAAAAILRSEIGPDPN